MMYNGQTLVGVVSGLRPQTWSAPSVGGYVSPFFVAPPSTVGARRWVGQQSATDVAVAKALAERELQNLASELQKGVPAPRSGAQVRLDRYFDRRGHGSTNNYSSEYNPGAHPETGVWPGPNWDAQRVDVAPGLRAYVWPQQFFRGQVEVLAPYAEYQKNPKSMVVVADFDYEGVLSRAKQAIKAAAQAGVLTAANWRSHPVVVALSNFYDQVVKAFGQSPLASQFAQDKLMFLNELAGAVVVQPGQAAPAQLMPTAAPVVVPRKKKVRKAKSQRGSFFREPGPIAKAMGVQGLLGWVGSWFGW